MLKTIITTSSNKGSIIFDCFFGSGGTLVAADDLDRNWIGIDKSEIAIQIALKRLNGRQNGLFHNNKEIVYVELGQHAIAA